MIEVIANTGFLKTIPILKNTFDFRFWSDNSPDSPYFLIFKTSYLLLIF